MQHHINPVIIDSILGTNSYNLGYDGNTIIECKMLFDFYMEKCTKPKMIVLNIDYEMFNTNREIFRADQYFPYINNKAVYNGLIKYDKKTWFARNIPFIASAFYNDYSLNLSLQAVIDPDRKKYTYQKGFLGKHGDWNNFADRLLLSVDSSYYTDEGFDLLEAFITKCKETSIKPVLVYSPQ